jgi:hypothetical protein
VVTATPIACFALAWSNHGVCCAHGFLRVGEVLVLCDAVLDQGLADADQHGQLILVLLLHHRQLRLQFDVQLVLGVGSGEFLHCLVELGAIVVGDRLLVLFVMAPVGAQIGVVGRWQSVFPQAIEITCLEQVDRTLQRGLWCAAARLRGFVLAVAGAQQQRGKQRQ